jgi:RNA polymerase sigma-70 factor, ECF subfamily
VSFICLYRRRVCFIPDDRTFLCVEKKEVTGNKSAFITVSAKRIVLFKGEGSVVLDSQDQARFEALVLPHLDAAHNLARWLLRGGADAEDVTQEAMLRAYRFFGGFHGGDVRAWLLQIVRNTCFTWMEKNRHGKTMTEFNEELHGPSSPNPEVLAIAADGHAQLTHALETLPPRFREVIVLRELEGCSYKEIATITSIPIGTVMSTLSRARRQLQLALGDPVRKEVTHEL